MPEPTRYIPGFNYSGWEADHPTEPKPGAELDNDFALIRHSIDETIRALKDVRRSDGKVQNVSVDFDALSPAVKAALANSDFDYEVIEDLLAKDANLSDLPDKAEAIENLGALGRDANLSDLTNLKEARANLGTFSTVADVQNSHIPAVLGSIRTEGYYEPGDGGHAELTEGSPSDPGAIQSGDGRWWRVADSKRNVRMFGARGDGESDDTAAILAADAAGPFEVSDGTYAVVQLELYSDFDMAPGAIFTALGSHPSTAVVRTKADGQRVGTIRVSIEGEFRHSGVVIEGSNTSVDYVEVYGVEAPEGSVVVRCCAINGEGSHIRSIYVHDTKNTGNGNPYMPQSVYVTTDLVKIDSLKCVRAQGASIVTVQESGHTSVDAIYVEDSETTGVYQLGGHLTIGLLHCNGVSHKSHPADFKGRATIGTMIVSGNAGIIGFRGDGTNVHIGDLCFRDTVHGSTGPLLRIRPDATSNEIGEVYIGRIHGECRIEGSLIWFLEDSGDVPATCEYLTIGSMDLTVRLNESANPSWIRLDACKGFSIGPATINAIDETDAHSGSVSMSAPTDSLVKRSYLRDFDVSVYKSDGVTPHPNLGFTGRNFAQELIYVYGGRWVTHVGPYLKEVGYGGPGSINNIPSGGYWHAGDDFALANATASPFRARCTVSGTPGTWVEYGYDSGP